jgi:ABC-type tungstate transport system permease subunit
MVQMAPNSQNSLIVSLIAGNSGVKARTAAVAFTMAFAVAIVFAGAASAQQKSDVVAFTTSTRDSGLLGHLLPPSRSMAAHS